MLKDITIQHGDFGTVQPEIIHISVKGKSLGTGSFLGMLLRHIEKEKGTDSGMAAFSLAMLADKPAVIYVDDVMAAADDTLLNPGALISYGVDIAKNASPKWTVIITKSIDIAKMAEAGDKGLYDDRNESAVKMAQKIRDAIGDDVLPYI